MALRAEHQRINNPDIKLIITYCGPYALDADVAVMRMANVDKATFGIFGADWSEELANRISMSETNASVLRGTVRFGGDFGKTVLASVTGTLPVNEDGVYYEPVVAVTVDNLAKQFES